MIITNMIAVRRKRQLPARPPVQAQLFQVLSVSVAYYTDFPSIPTSQTLVLTPDHSIEHTSIIVPTELKHNKKNAKSVHLVAREKLKLLARPRLVRSYCSVQQHNEAVCVVKFSPGTNTYGGAMHTTSGE